MSVTCTTLCDKVCQWLAQHYVIKFVSNLQQVGGFLWVLRFLPSIKLTTTLNTITLTPLFFFSFREAKFLTFYSKSELIKFSKVKFENCDDWFDPCVNLNIGSAQFSLNSVTTFRHTRNLRFLAGDISLKQKELKAMVIIL